MHTVDEDTQRCLLLSLLDMHTCIDTVYPFRVDPFREGVDRMMREIGVDRQVVVLAELLAKIGEAGVNSRFAPGDVDQPRLTRGIEPFFPLDVGAINTQPSPQHSGGKKTVGTTEITSR